MLRREASRWLARLQSGDPDARIAFERWCAADPRHSAAFNRVQGSYARAGLLNHSVIAQGRSRLAKARAAPIQSRFAIAAGLAVALLVPSTLVYLYATGRPPFEPIQAMLLSTRAGETRSETLADGSVLTLDGESVVRVALGRGRREMRMQQGRIRFDIAGAHAPFVVIAGDTRVRAGEHAILDVTLNGGLLHAKVLSGAATVSGVSQGEGGQPVVLSTGQRLTRSGSGAFTTARTDTGRVGLVDGVLQFQAAPLLEVVTAANRHSDRHILLRDEAIGRLRVTGAFEAGNAAGLAQGLARSFGLRVEGLENGDYLLTKATKKNGG